MSSACTSMRHVRQQQPPLSRCGKRRFQYALVTVQTHRDLLNTIAERLGVRHETPQAILVRAGRALWSASHFRVNAPEIKRALAAVQS